MKCARLNVQYCVDFDAYCGEVWQSNAISGAKSIFPWEEY